MGSSAAATKHFQCRISSDPYWRMEQHHAPAPPPAYPARSHWTPAKQRIFLIALLDTGCVTRAARAAGMSRSSAQRLRSRLTGTPFDRAWQQAILVHARRLNDPFAQDMPQRQSAASPARR